MNTDINVFQAVQQKFSIINIAKDLGLSVKKIGASYRSDSIDNSGRGENALALYTNTNTWYDFMLETGGYHKPRRSSQIQRRHQTGSSVPYA